METEQKRSFIVNFVYYLIISGIFILAVKYGLPMLAPFVLGFLIAYILRGLILSVSRKLNLPYKLASFVLVLLFYCTIGSLIALLSIKTVSIVVSFIQALPHIYSEHFEPALAVIFTNLETLAFNMDLSLYEIIESFSDQFMQWLASFISSLSSWAVGTASNIATAVPGLFIKLVLMIISSFFIAADYDVLSGFCLRQLGKKGQSLFHQIKDYLVGTLFVCIRSYAIIITLTFFELSLGLSILDVRHAVLIAALIAVFDILPVLGTGGIMIPWCVLTLLQGRFKLALGLLLLYIIITVIRNIVEPKIVGSQLGLHPVVTLSSMFAGVQLLGVIGLFGFPIGLSLLRYLNDQGSIHIFKTAEDTAE